MNKRIEWIDELKGFVLLSVCLAHIPLNLPFINTALTISTAFRMTTFFFLSGILFSTRKHNTLNSYFHSKKTSLLYPYICLSLLFLILDLRIWNINLIQHSPVNHIYPHPIENSIEYIHINLIEIFLKGGSSCVSGPLWFVWVLFIVSIMFYCIHKISKGNQFIILLYACICILSGWIMNIHSIVLPFRLATVFTASFFFTLGYLSKNYLHLLTDRGGVKILFTIIFTFIPYMYFINKNGAISLWSNFLGGDFLFFILSTLTGIFLIINIFILFSRSKNKISKTIKGILRNIARNALIILAVHYWTISCCKIFIHEHKITFTLLSVITTCIIAIPLFRNKLYPLIGKKKISIKESLSIK